MLYLGVFLAIILLLASYLYCLNMCEYWVKQGVKQAPRLGFLKFVFNFLLSKESPGTFVKNVYNYDQNEPYIGFYALNKPALLLRDPAIINELLVTEFKSFSDKFMRSSEKDNLSNESIPFVKNPHWKELRKRLSPAFSPKNSKNTFEIQKQILINLDNYLDSLELDGLGKTLDIKEICARLMTDVVGSTQFGLQLNSIFDMDCPFRKFGRMMFGDFNWRRSFELMSIYLVPQITTFFDFRFFEKQSGEFFRKEFKKILDERKFAGVKNNDLMELLIQINNKNDGFHLTENQIIAQLIVLFTAGFDTTSTVMTFTLLELAKNKRIQNKLRSEIHEVMQNNNGDLTSESLDNLSYLDNVVNETLRLHPTVPTIDRIATKDYTITKTGLSIEKGTPIFISILGLHYDEKYFRNPKIFDPENFSQSNTRLRNPIAFIPFGIGPRSCIARRLGLSQTKYGVAHIVSKYEVSISEEVEPKVDTTVYFTAGKGGIFLNLKKLAHDQLFSNSKKQLSVSIKY